MDENGLIENEEEANRLKLFKKLLKTVWTIKDGKGISYEKYIRENEKEISDLKAKNKELEDKVNTRDEIITDLETENSSLCANLTTARTKLAKATRLLLSDNSELLDALRDTLDLVQLTDKHYKDRIEYINGQALITKYRG